MYIIAGLGNPKKEYENTRHNIGFDVVDALAKEMGILLIEHKHKAIIGKGILAGEKVILAKPQTFMNLSGESIRQLIDYYKIDEQTQLIIIYDDISLDVGQLRIRKKGSAGGHNGIKSILSHLGHDTFLRVKMGVGEKPAHYDLADYVLGHFTQAERKVMNESTQSAIKAIELMVKGQSDKAMNDYNKKAAELS